MLATNLGLQSLLGNFLLFLFYFQIAVNFTGVDAFSSDESFDFYSPAPYEYAKCGEVFDCKSGGIFYQPLEPISENERCIWQIAVKGAEGYKVKILHYGYSREDTPPEDHGIVLTAFSGNRSPVNYFPNSTETILISDCSLLIVTLYTGPDISDNTGFALKYTSSSAWGNVPYISEYSVHYFVGPELYYLHHPRGEFYQKNELTSFVFLPSDNGTDSESHNTIVYREDGPVRIREDYCGDKLKVYYFRVGNGTDIGWEFMGRICGDQNTARISNTEPIIIIFETDNRLPKSTGFHFAYVA